MSRQNANRTKENYIQKQKPKPCPPVTQNPLLCIKVIPKVVEVPLFGNVEEAKVTKENVFEGSIYKKTS